MNKVKIVKTDSMGRICIKSLQKGRQVNFYKAYTNADGTIRLVPYELVRIKGGSDDE